MPEVFSDTDKQSHDLFHSYCRFPGILFEGQHEHEIVLLTLRAHPLTQIIWITLSFFGFVLPLIIDVFLIGRASPSAIFFGNIFWWALVSSFAFYNLIRWVFNVGIVTNERVLDVDYVFIQKEVSEAAAFDIADADAKTTGFFQDLFNFGDVFIQTAGTKSNIEYLHVPHPNEVVAIVSKVSHDSHGNN